MKFRSPTEEPIYMGLTNGHTFVIGADLVEVPKRFHRQAVMEGAIPEGMDAAPIDEEGSNPSQHDLIVTAMRAMIERADIEDFTKDGKPDTRKLSSRVGFTVLTAQRDAAWDEVKDD